MGHNKQINSLFDVDKNDQYTKKALIYQDVIRYCIIRPTRSPNSTVFKHREIAKWLVNHNQEFMDRYKDPSTRHITISNRVEDTQRRTKNCIDDLITLRLVRKVGTAKQDKGTGIVDLYEYTMYATFVACIIDASTGQNSVAINQLFKVINSFGFRFVSIYRIQNGKMAETWHVVDGLPSKKEGYHNLVSRSNGLMATGDRYVDR
jgi:hypothetical protein